MAKPDPQQILRDAHRLRDERFKQRDRDIEQRRRERFGQTEIDIPTAYRKSAMVYHTPAIREEGRNVFALVHAFPQAHLTPPSPEEQSQTTAVEKFLAACHQELESCYGHVWSQAGLAQLHDRIGWVKSSLRRDFYANAPTAPKQDAEDYADQLIAYEGENESYKKEAGADALFDYSHPPTNTVYPRGSVWNPLAVYEVKEIEEDELLLQFPDLTRDSQGRLTSGPPTVSGIPGQPPQKTRNNKTGQSYTFVEYWDRQWCVQVVSSAVNWKKNPPVVLDTWEHGFGRVPYFAIPAFETEVPDEDKKFESPLDSLYAEAGRHNTLITMDMNVAHLVSYPSWQLINKEGQDQILDDTGKPKTHIDFEPGRFFQNAPGQVVEPLPMAKGNDLARQVVQSFELVKQYSLSPVSKGISPGADTANSAVATLQRLQRSNLDPLVENQSWAARELYRFWLTRIKQDVKQTVYATDPKLGETQSLAPEQVVSTNIQAKVLPDTGSDALIEEKQAAEMTQLHLITPLEFHERRGKENPEEYVRAQVMWDVFEQLKPSLAQQVLANLGNSDAIARMVAANQQSGSARDAVSSIMGDIRGQAQPQTGPSGPQPGGAPPPTNGIGSGSPGMPRQQGVLSPAVQQTTQPMLANGVARGQYTPPPPPGTP